MRSAPFKVLAFLGAVSILTALVIYEAWPDKAPAVTGVAEPEETATVAVEPVAVAVEASVPAMPSAIASAAPAPTIDVARLRALRGAANNGTLGIGDDAVMMGGSQSGAFVRPKAFPEAGRPVPSQAP